jgi:hypothetical protein
MQSMKYWLILLFTASGAAITAQPKRLDPQGDTSFWFALKQKDVARIGLTDLTKTSDSLHLRYWMENQAVDIWTTNGSTYSGIVSLHTVSINTNKQGNVKPGKYYSKKENLTAAETRSIYELFRTTGVLQFPTDKNINGWTYGFDGAEYLLEYATNNSYSFKAYWTPTVQKDVPEADSLNRLNKMMGQLLHLKERWGAFIKGLPDGCYQNGEVMQVCKFANARRNP